ncbi:PREDICTED: zonadhesin-like [Branchiostoma belcheri]|uniref:Zonadhesin-like n=1 Tax=Branchiostoma belcheri TaxID=7741 RepID=A0A6P5A0V6_BRABE|nr:PREDICTED: zonadhesin-like [Branchiostoma belcheri]
MLSSLTNILPFDINNATDNTLCSTILRVLRVQKRKTSRRSCPDGLHFDIGNHPYGCEEPEYATCARCPESSHWTSCNGNCRPTCDDPNPVCPKICRPGCKCNQGYVWYGEKCIAEHACRYKPSGGQGACPENSHWNTCGDLCVGTCDNPRPPCPRICAEPACACNDGYVSHNGKCIPESQCPKQLGRESVPECKYGAYYNSATGQCVCDQACDRKLHRVCGSDGQIYNNPCLLEVAACVNQQDIRIIGEPPCPSSGQV